MKKAITLLLLFLVACGPREVKREATGPTVEVEKTISCNYTGFCYTCMPGFNGQMECGFKISPYCSGNQTARFKETPIKITYEDDTVRLTTQEGYIRPVTECR